MTDLIRPNSQPGSQLIIAGEDIPFGAYQAIYHSLTKKVERRTKSYKDAFDINFSDVQNLHLKITQAIKQYSVKSSRCQVTHQFSDDTSREHSSFERFKLSDCTTRSCTSDLSYEFDFLVILPPEIPEAQELAQRYKIVISIEQDSLEQDPDRPYFLRQMLRTRTVQMSIEFADYAVSQALFSIIDGWINSLPKREPGSVYAFFNKTEKSVRLYFNGIVRFAVLLSGAYAAYGAKSIKEAFFVTLLFFAFSVLLPTFADAFIERGYESFALSKPITNILITQGDADRLNDIRKRQNLMSSIARFMLFGIVFTLILGLSSNYIYDVLKTKLM